MKRESNTQTLAWFYDLFTRELLDLDPPYQRRSVWNKSYKQYFIDTILHDFPSPPIFLTRIIEGDGTTRYAVVDGKQRLLSIFEFIQDELSLRDDFGDARLNGKYFSELEDVFKTKFWSYVISVETLSEFSDTEINQSFDRLNRNVLKLMPQELRHAMYEGRFISLVNELSEDPFWQDVCISTRNSVRRMRDVEFISELFLLTMNGIQTTTKNTLDRDYANYDEEITNEEVNRRKFDSIRGLIRRLNLDICGTRLKNYSDFYTLWSSLLDYVDHEINIEETRVNIMNFTTDLESITPSTSEDELDPESRYLVRYQRAVTSRPYQIGNRTIRHDIFKELIVINDNSV